MVVEVKRARKEPCVVLDRQNDLLWRVLKGDFEVAPWSWGLRGQERGLLIPGQKWEITQENSKTLGQRQVGF